MSTFIYVMTLLSLLTAFAYFGHKQDHKHFTMRCEQMVDQLNSDNKWREAVCHSLGDDVACYNSALAVYEKEMNKIRVNEGCNFNDQH